MGSEFVSDVGREAEKKTFDFNKSIYNISFCIAKKNVFNGTR